MLRNSEGRLCRNGMTALQRHQGPRLALVLWSVDWGHSSPHAFEMPLETPDIKPVSQRMKAKCQGQKKLLANVFKGAFSGAHPVGSASSLG